MPPAAPARRTLRRRVVGLALAVAVPLAALFIARAIIRRAEEGRRLQDRAAELVGIVVHDLDAQVEATEAQLRTIARLVDATAPRDAQDARLADVLATAPSSWTNLFVLDTGGTLVASARPPRRAREGWTRTGTRPGVQRALADGRFTVADVARSLVRPDSAHILTFYLPLRDAAGRITGLLGTAIPLDSLDGLQVAGMLPPGSVITVMDTTGTVLMRTLDPDHWIGRDFGASGRIQDNVRKRRGVDASTSADGTTRLIGWDLMRSTGWIAYLGIPVAYTTGAAWRQFAGDLAMGALLTLLVLLWARRVAARIVGPIEQLTDDARRIAAGDETRRSALATGDEIGELARAVNRMADTAAARRDQLLESQDQLRHAQKMDALGTFAGGIAHDFNNYLAAIAGYVELAHATLPAAHAARGDLDEALRATQRAGELTRQILLFSRREALHPELLDPADVLADVDLLLAPLMGATVTIECHVDHGDARVRADRGTLVQVLVNLGVNARDAMPEGGRFTLASRLVVRDAGDSMETDLGPGEWVVLSATDTGAGMSEAVRARVFEPFFTTKEGGRGTGLGLAVAWSIVRQAGGTIRVETAPGCGSSFHVWLPAVRTTATTPVPAAPGARPALPRPAGEAVLVVDDDAAVRTTTARALRRAGFTVHEAGDAAAALAALAGAARDVAVVVSDVVMPGMSGGALALRLQATHPGLPVLLTSGYADDTHLGEATRSPLVAFLAKPFTGEQLVEAVTARLTAAATVPAAR